MRAVFVSSTFRDMQFERDALLTRVLPRLNDFLGRYAEVAHFGDLRWGVNTTELESEESSRKVLKVCLDEIDGCKPYMIVFIGERYGWIPSGELLHSAALLKGMDIGRIAPDTSVTELEIEYGALTNPDLEGRVLFYFRNPFDMSEMTEGERASYASESELHKRKIAELKAEILEKYPDYVRYYDVTFDPESRALVGLEPLMDMIYEDLKRIFDIDLSYLASLSKEERAVANSDNYFRKLSENTVVRAESYVNSFDTEGIEYAYEYRYDNNPVLEIITGETGMGAKTVLAQQLLRIEERGEYAIPLVYGLDEFTRTVEDIRSALVYKLESFMSLEHGGDSSADRLADLLNEYTTVKELPYLHILIMNAPKSLLTTLHVIGAKYPYLFGIGFHVHFREQLERSDSVPFFLKNYVTYVDELSEEQQRLVVDSILRARHKELPDVVINGILSHGGASNALYLSLIVDRLIMLDSQDFAAIRAMGDGMDNINKYMLRLISDIGDDISDIAHDLLKELCERINPVMIPHLIAHLTLRSHLSEAGIKSMFDHYGWGYNSLDYTLFKRTFPSLVYEDSKGMLWFANDDVRAGALALLSEYGMDGEIDKVIDYVFTLSDSVGGKAAVAYLAEAGRAEDLCDVILPHLDKPMELVAKGSPDEKAMDNYGRYINFIYRQLDTSVENGDSFAEDIISVIADRIAEGRVEYPYTVLSGIFNFLIPSFDDYNTLINTAAALVEITDAFEKYSEDSEPCLVAVYMLRSLIHPAYSGHITEEWFSDYTSECVAFNQKYRDTLSGLILKLTRERLLYLGELSGINVNTAYSIYSMLKDIDNPATDRRFGEAYGKLKHYTVALRAHVDKYAPDYFDRISEGDISPVNKLGDVENQLYWLAFSGYISAMEGDTDAADNYYYTLLSLHTQIVTRDGIGDFFLGHYVSLLCDALRYLGERGYDISGIFTSVLEWALIRLARRRSDFSLTVAIMDMHILGADKEYITGGALRFFYQVWSCVRGQIYYASELVGIVKIPEYFCRFNYVFKDSEDYDETFEYYSDLYSELVYANSEQWKKNPDIAAAITGHFVVNYAMDKELDKLDVLSDLIDKAVSDYPEVKKLCEKIKKVTAKRLKGR